MTSPTIRHVRELLDAARSRGSGSIARIAEAYDEYLLERDNVPEEAWNVLVSIFSDPAVLRLRGAERFLLEMNTDLEKYSPVQISSFLQVLESAIPHMDHVIARHAAGDLIARAYPAEVAIRAFERLALGTVRQKHSAFVGLDILMRHDSTASEPRVRELYLQLLATEGDWGGTGAFSRAR